MKNITKLLAVLGLALTMSSGASAVTIDSVDEILPYDCDSFDGQIDVEVTGFGPFTYTLQGPMFGIQLPNQPDTISFPNLGAGTYTLTVLDQYDNSTDMTDISLQPYGEICSEPGCPIEDFGLESSFDCDTLRGAITITDLEAELAYAVTFEGPMGISTGDIVSDPAGQIVFDNLEVGTYLITVCDVGPKTVVLTAEQCIDPQPEIECTLSTPLVTLIRCKYCPQS